MTSREPRWSSIPRLLSKRLLAYTARYGNDGRILARAVSAAKSSVPGAGSHLLQSSAEIDSCVVKIVEVYIG